MIVQGTKRGKDGRMIGLQEWSAPTLRLPTRVEGVLHSPSHGIWSARRCSRSLVFPTSEIVYADKPRGLFSDKRPFANAPGLRRSSRRIMSKKGAMNSAANRCSGARSYRWTSLRNIPGEFDDGAGGRVTALKGKLLCSVGASPRLYCDVHLEGRCKYVISMYARRDGNYLTF